MKIIEYILVKRFFFAKVAEGNNENLRRLSLEINLDPLLSVVNSTS